jgi:hypothetical protein
MTALPPHIISPVLRSTARIITWGAKKSLSPPESLKALNIDVAMEVALEDASGDLIILEHSQFEEIQDFLADPAVVSMARLRFMRRIAPSDAATYLDEVASLATFQQMVHTWCEERSQTWQDLAEHLWIQIEHGQAVLLERIQQSGALTEIVSDLLLNRFLFGHFGDSGAPEYVRLINELAQNPVRQQQMNDLLRECARRTTEGTNDEFLVLGMEEDSAKFDELYVDRSLIDASTGDTVSASQQLDIRQACPRVVVIGDPGVGKSTLTSWAKWKATSDTSDSHSPVIVTLVSRYDLADASSTILSAIRRHFETRFLLVCDEKLLSYLLAVGWVTLVVDGVDEILDVTQRRRIVDQLNTIAEEYPATPIICTTRRSGFEIAHFRSRTFNVLMLGDYTDQQIAEYARKWFTTARWGLKADRFLGESRTLGDLVKNPLMLALLCTLYRQYDYIPESRRELYLRCASLMFYEWDPRRGIAIPNLFKKEGETILRDVALLLLRAGGVGSSIDEEQLLALVKRHLEDKGQEPVAALDAARELLDYCSRRAWILSKVASPGNISRFSFTHRTFFEFFASEAIIRKLNHEHALARSIQQREAQGGRLGPVSRAILEVFEADETSVMPELLLQAADDLMGGISTPVLDELQRAIMRAEGSRRASIITLCVRLIAAGGAHSTVVERVFDAAASLWSGRENESLSLVTVSLSDFRALLNISPGYRTRFIQRCLEDKEGLGWFFLRRYVRLSVIGESGLYSDEWRNCAMSLVGASAASEDPFELKYRWLVGALTVDEATRKTKGIDLLILSVDNYDVEGILWDSFTEPGPPKARAYTWAVACKSLVSDREISKMGSISLLGQFAERRSRVDGMVVPLNLALIMGVIMRPNGLPQVARLTGHPELAELDDVLTNLFGAQRFLRRGDRSRFRSKGDALYSIEEAKKRYSEVTGKKPPDWLLNHLI